MRLREFFDLALDEVLLAIYQLQFQRYHLFSFPVVFVLKRLFQLVLRLLIDSEREADRLLAWLGCRSHRCRLLGLLVDLLLQEGRDLSLRRWPQEGWSLPRNGLASRLLLPQFLAILQFFRGWLLVCRKLFI